ncbi:SusD family protein [compost metagenome]
MYAEALNEANGPSTEVYTYLDRIRERAGLAGIVESWSSFSTNPSKPNTKDGLREIIQRERMIELVFEGKRYWDLRRWKLAVNYFNQNITGWSVNQEVTSDYYRLRTLYAQTFVAPRDYFWPIAQGELTVNPSLMQNLGW